MFLREEGCPVVVGSLYKAYRTTYFFFLVDDGSVFFFHHVVFTPIGLILLLTLFHIFCFICNNNSLINRPTKIIITISQHKSTPPSIFIFGYTSTMEQQDKRPRTHDEESLLAAEIKSIFGTVSASGHFHDRKKPRGERDDFRNLSDKYKQQVRSKICMEVFDIFIKYNMHHVDDMREVLTMFSKNYIGEKRNDQEVDFENALKLQISSLSLPMRNALCRVLTHTTNNQGVVEVNERLLKVIPFLSNRSRRVLEMDKQGRKERNDKINLQFIVDFMHDFCRYV